MKIHEYNEMMSYLTRPARVGFSNGGRIGFSSGGDTSPVYNETTGHIYKKGNKWGKYYSKTPPKNQFTAVKPLRSLEELQKVIDEAPLLEIDGKFFEQNPKDLEGRSEYSSKELISRRELDKHRDKLKFKSTGPKRIQETNQSNITRRNKIIAAQGSEIPIKGGKKINRAFSHVYPIIGSAKPGTKITTTIDAAMNSKLIGYNRIGQKIAEDQEYLLRVKPEGYKKEILINNAKAKKNVMNAIQDLGKKYKGQIGYFQVDPETGVFKPKAGNYKMSFAGIEGENKIYKDMTSKERQAFSKKISAIERLKTIPGTTEKLKTIPDITTAKINDIGKMLLEGADKSTIMKIRKVLGCMSEGGRVGLQGGGNLLECPMAKFAENPEAVLNKIGQTMPEARPSIINTFKKLGTLKPYAKLGMGTLKWGGRAFIGLTPIFAGMEIADAVEKYEEGVPSGQIAMDAFGNWVLPGAGGMYKRFQDKKMMKDIGTSEEVAAMEKEDDRRYYNMLQEDPLREADYSKKLEETQTTPEEQLELFKLMEKQKAAEYWNQQRTKGERAEIAEESTDTFSNLEDWSAAEGGRAGFDEGSKLKSPSRRAFIKGITALAALPLVGKYFKLGKVLERASTYTGPAIQKIKGMPEWFPGLIKKLWNEGEDVTKQVAYQERQVVKRGTLESGDDVDLIYDAGTGDVSIIVTPKKGTHQTGSGAYNKEYSLDYKKGIGDESTKGTPPDEFGVTETQPTRTGHPEDPDWDWDGIDTTADDAITDLTELEAFSKNKSVKNIHKKKGTKPKDVNPEIEYPEYDYGDYDID